MYIQLKFHYEQVVSTNTDQNKIIKHYIFKGLILIVIYMDFYLSAGYIFGTYQLYIYIWNLSAVYLYLDSYLSAVYKFRLLPFSFINIWTPTNCIYLNPTYQLYIFLDSYLSAVYRDVNVFIFQKNYRFVMKTTTKNRKQNDRF